MKKKILCLITAFLIVIYALPLTASAAANDGWQKLGGRWQYQRDGELLTDGFYQLPGYKNNSYLSGQNLYNFDANGNMITGFMRADTDFAGYIYFGEVGSSPEKSALGALVMNWYVKNPPSGYRTPAEGERDYYYYFNADGLMYTGWQRNALTLHKWRYFGEEGAFPETSTLGRRFAYGAQEAIGNSGETNLYMFTETGNMYHGTNALSINGAEYTFTDEGQNPAADALGKGVMATE